MAKSRRNWGWKLGLVSFVVPPIAIACSLNSAIAQIVPDATLGAENSVLTPNQVMNGTQGDRIDGGAMRGANLFHSFREFSINEGRGAYFTNPSGIENILSRVTGGNPSNIFGKLGVLGNANLFLINPNGIIFGPSSSLEIGGSFVGTTANAIQFGEQGFFSASNPNAPPLLTVNPSAFVFNQITPASIVNRSRSNAGQDPARNDSSYYGLRVPDARSLLLVGGDIQVDSGGIVAFGGRVDLAAVAGAGTVGLNVNDTNLSLSVPDSVPRADVSLTNKAGFIVAAGGGGSIAITAQNIDILKGSGLYAGILRNLGSVDAQAGDITLNATGIVTVANTNGGISNDVSPGGTGDAGNLTIETGRLIVSSSQVSASTLGVGNAGNMTVRASDSVELSGEIPGEGGEYGFPGGLLAQVNQNQEATGAGGNLTIETGRLSVSNGSKVQVATFGEGDAGNLLVRAPEIDIFNTPDSNNFFSTGIFAGVQIDPRNMELARGDGGNLTIETARLRIRNGGRIDTSTYGIGNAGNLRIRAADSIEVDGVSKEGVRSLIAAPIIEGAAGRGGNVNIETGRLSVRDGGRVSVRTLGEGQGGNVRINADEVEVFGIGITQEENYPAEITAGVGEQSTSTGGNLRIEVEKLNVRDGGIVSVSTEGSGDAGNLEIAANSILLEDKGSLRADTTEGEGNILINSEDLVLRRGSSITTDARGNASGGNITINTGVLAALENSDISANAQNAGGGRVIINASGILGTEFRNQLTPESDITATSDLGSQFSGTVEINTPDVDPEQGLVKLPAELADASNQIASGGCAVGQNKFTIAGRGGLPPNPREPLNGEAMLTNWATLEPEVETRSSAAPSANPTKEATPAQIVEATGWAVNGKGEVVLTAAAPTDNLNIPWLPESSCHASEPSS